MCLVSGDDWINERNIEVKLKYFENDPSLAMVDSGGYKYYEELKIYEPIEVTPVDRKDVLQKLFKINFITGLGCVSKKKSN